MWKTFIYEQKETDYEVSQEGNIRNKTTLLILKGSLKKEGYLEYQLYLNDQNISILGHRIVALTYLPNPNNYPQVNHINGIKTDNEVTNLEWVSSSQNNQHAWDIGLNKPHVERQVIQYSLTGTYIATHKSVASAKQNTGAAKIREVANHERKTSGGFCWEWAEDFIPEDRGKAKKVAQLNEDGSIKELFNSVSEAARQTGASRKGISAVCLGKQITCFNYKWKFLDDDIVR